MDKILEKNQLNLSLKWEWKMQYYPHHTITMFHGIF
jgi:hypothetical protein